MSFGINSPDPKCNASDKLDTKINVGSMTKESRTLLCVYIPGHLK